MWQFAQGGWFLPTRYIHKNNKVMIRQDYTNEFKYFEQLFFND